MATATAVREEPLLVTPTVAAFKLGISRAQLYRELAKGSLRSLRIGTARRISAKAIADYIAAREAECAA